MKMVDWALKYAELGFSVIPMIDKRPIISFADKPALTKREIVEIWRKNPNANIAVRTIDFFVVDIDVHENADNGYKSIALYEKPEHFKNTMYQNTPSGGEQLFYKKINGKPSNQNINWLPGVDIKAHPNNYVMVPPSSTKKGVYEWNVPIINDETVNETNMVVAHKGLIEAVKLQDTNDGFIKPNYNRFKQSGVKTKTAELFETIGDGFGSESSGRNDKLTKFVGGLLARNVDVERIRELAITTNNNSLDPLPNKELNLTVESIIKKHFRERGA